MYESSAKYAQNQLNQQVAYISDSDEDQSPISKKKQDTENNKILTLIEDECPKKEEFQVNVSPYQRYDH